MDIFPSAVNTIINHQGVTALSQKIQNLEYIDLAEKAIKALERISSESAISVLSNANIDIILNMMDFFELDIQISIIKMISNICMNLHREEDMRKLTPILPALTNFFEVRGTSDKHAEMFGLMCTSFQYICDSSIKVKELYGNPQSASELMEKCYQFMFRACNSAKFFEAEVIADTAENEDNTVNIIIANLGKLIKIVSHLCKYSSENCHSAITDMNMLQIIHLLLKREHSRDKASMNVLPETLSLLGALIPDSRAYKNDTSEFALNEKAKSTIFEDKADEDNPYKIILVESILPSMLKLYVSAFSQNIKFTFLQLIEEIFLMLSGETLKEYLKPYVFSRFVITTMKSENYTWIEMCLRIMQILTDKKVSNCNLALHREGIQDYLRVFADKEKFKELTGIQINEEDIKEETKKEVKDEQKQTEPSQPKSPKAEPDSTMKATQEASEEQKAQKEATGLSAEDRPDQTVEEKVTESQDKPVTEEVKKEEIETKEVSESPEGQAKEPPAPTEEQKQETVEKVVTSPPATEDEKKQNVEEPGLPKLEGKIEESPSQIEPPEPNKTKALSEQVNELKQQKMYLDDLKMAIKESMSEIVESGHDLEESVKEELKKEEDTIKETSKKELAEEDISTLSKKKKSGNRKLKKMFIKRAIQNLDDSLEGIEDIGEFDEGEIAKIKDIIAKKRMLHKNRAMYSQEARKYSRDFISMNTAPMYKNIVSTSKKLLEAFEASLKDEFSNEANTLGRLTELANDFFDESKNSDKFNREKTIKMYNTLAGFYKAEHSTTKITQYELHKSKIVDALHSFLSLPTKEEESKSSNKSEDKPAEQHQEEYFTILSRYMCLVEVFCEDKSDKDLKALINTFENAIKISFNSYYQQELTSYHDGVNLAYDLKKYSKRNRLQLTYEPDIERKIAEAEAAESGKPYEYKKSIKEFFKAKQAQKPGQYKGESFEDEEFMKNIPEPSMEKYMSKQETQSKPLLEKEKRDAPKSNKEPEDEHSLVYLKRDALYRELKSVAVSVENSSTLEVIKDFLRTRVRKRDHVKQLKTQTGSVSNQMQSIFDRARKHISDRASGAGGGSSNIQDILSKMVFESFNDSGTNQNISEEERLLLIKDLETVIGKPPGSTFQPPPGTISFTTKEENKEEENKTSTEELKDTEESKTGKSDTTKETTNKLSDKKVSKDMFGSSESEEEDLDFGDKGANMGFFGKLKKFFFKGQPKKGHEFEEEGEEDEEEKTEEETLVKKSTQELNKEKEGVKKESSNKDEEEKIDTRRNEYIDAPLSLKDLTEDEDVEYEFYYNRIKIPDTKTIYELINYQPTYRNITDPHIVYFKIKDRKQEDTQTISEEDTTLLKTSSSKERKSSAIEEKDSKLKKKIHSNTRSLLPRVSYFMERYISPYVKPDLKKLEQNTGAYQNPYSYNQNVPKPATNKIGVTTDEQRESSKKAVKITEAITYILTNWKDCATQVSMHGGVVAKDTLMVKPDTLFKHLLDEYIQKLLLEPLNLVLGNKKHKTEELMNMLMGNPHLLNFETRVFFYKMVAFAFSGDFNRTVHCLIQQLRRKHPNIPDQAISKQSKQKVKIDRKNLLESVITLFTKSNTLKRKNFLEIEYLHEEGTGLGPTLEFYYLCSKEFRNLTKLWKVTEDNSLFPAPLQISAEVYGEEKVLKCFETMGMLIGRAIADDRLTDLPFSSVFWELATGVPRSFDQIVKLDSVFGTSINELRDYSARKERIINNQELDDQIKERQLESCTLRNGAKVEDLFLFFVIPGTEIELKPKGKDIQVNDNNLKEYLDLLLDVMLHKSIEKQIEAFKKGFNNVVNIEYLKVLKSEEIELIVCGNNDDDKEWTSQILKENIIPAYGFHENSSTYLNLIEYMVKMDKAKRRQFLTFVTGSPRLPYGGFKNLKPKMNVVRKDEGYDNPNLFLPSVMTCQNFLKVPDYSTVEILEERFDMASSEGQENFTLS